MPLATGARAASRWPLTRKYLAPRPPPLPVPLPRWTYALKAVGAGVAVAVLVHLAHPADVLAALRGADARFALAALALLPLNLALESYRWARLVRCVAPHVPLRRAMAAVVAAYPVGLLTPGRVGDYVGRAVLLRDVPAGVSAALTFGERMATLAWCLAAGLVALGPYLAANAVPSPAATALVAVAAGGTLALFAALLVPSMARAVLGAVLPFERVRRALASFDRVPASEAGRLVALSGLRYAVFSAQFVCLVFAFAPGATLAGASLGVALTFFAKSAVPQVTLGDLGVRESAAVFFLGAYGVPAAAALDASLAVFAVNLVLPALAGLPLLWRARLAGASAPGPLTSPAVEPAASSAVEAVRA